VQDPPAPWRPRGAHAVGGLTDVGFGRGTDLLLVVSHDGRGVFDCLTGARVARDPSMPEPDEDDWQDTHELEAEGIGPLAGQTVRTSGLAGGGLPEGTPDGWVAERPLIAADGHQLGKSLQMATRLPCRCRWPSVGQDAADGHQAPCRCR
jgi:hypothetical protein